MRINFGNEPSVVERQISHPDFGDCFISIKPPANVVERSEYWALRASQNFEGILSVRLRAVVGWRDVLDKEGVEVPFNQNKFHAALALNNSFFAAVVDAVEAVWVGNHTLTETQTKNSSAPSGTTNPAAAVLTTPQ